MQDQEPLKSYAPLIERINLNGARALEISKKYPKIATALLLHTVIPPPEIEMVYEEVRASLELSHAADQNIQNMLKSLKPKELTMLSSKDQLHEPIAVAATHLELYPSPLKYQLQSYKCLSDGIQEATSL